tara:strand:+ start:138 stop:404 length:267 start_codon:yes stop_codon:yes gene_type:complete
MATKKKVAKKATKKTTSSGRILADKEKIIKVQEDLIDAQKREIKRLARNCDILIQEVQRLGGRMTAKKGKAKNPKVNKKKLGFLKNWE